MPLLIASSPICWILDNSHSPLTYLDLIESIILEISFSLFLIMYCSNFLLKTLFIDKAIDNITTVSYTHLDVYKRQIQTLVLGIKIGFVRQLYEKLEIKITKF